LTSDSQFTSISLSHLPYSSSSKQFCVEACTPALISAGIVSPTIDEILVLLAGQDVSSGC
jgi:hypothetical protein